MTQEKENFLWHLLKAVIPVFPHSRIHSLKTFTARNGACFVKREDELGGLISGAKFRKYLSLLPALKQQKIEEAIVIGGAYSNNVLGLSQLLLQNDILPHLFLLGTPHLLNADRLSGNLLFTSLLVSPTSFHWIDRPDWPQVLSLAEAFRQGKETIKILPEGAFCEEALPGVVTLTLDILRNEKESGLTFSHIFIDAGTGLTALVTILVFAWLEKETTLHVLLLAEEEPAFKENLLKVKIWFEKFVGSRLDEALLKNYKTYRPSQGRSFGSMPKAVLHQIKAIARQEGFLVDPLYSAKLFLEVPFLIEAQALEGNILILHSGGAFTLAGFQSALMPLLSKDLS